MDVSESIYREFEEYAIRVERTAPELIREAIEVYREQKILPHRKSVLDIQPVSVGKVIRPVGPDDDLLGEMLGS